MCAQDYLPPPVRVEPLPDVLARFGGTCETRPDGDWLARLPQGRVYGSGIVLSPDGQSIISDYAADFARGEGPHWLQRYPQIRPPTRIEGVTAVVAVNLGSGYAHWLLEELPRLLLLRASDAETVIANTLSPFSREVFSYANFPWRRVQVKRHSHFVCDVAVLPGPTACSTQGIERVRTFAEKMGKSPHVPVAEKLYLTREGATRRRTRNEAALWAQLEARGFTKLSLEALSWRDQVTVFAGAKVVVSPHGAGLANVIFCQRGTRVVEFFHPEYVNPYYENLCRTCGLDYRRALPAGTPILAPQPRAGRLDIEADLPAVVSALAAE